MVLHYNSQDLGALVAQYKDPLYHLCLHLAGNKHEADDLFQDTWLKVAQNINRFDTNRSFKAWLFAIATNLYKDRWRKWRRWQKLIRDGGSDWLAEQLEKVAADMPGPENIVMQGEVWGMLHQAVTALEDELRIPLILHYFRDCSYKEVAEIMNIPEGTAKSRVHKARAKIRAHMEVKSGGRKYR